MFLRHNEVLRRKLHHFDSVEDYICSFYVIPTQLSHLGNVFVMLSYSQNEDE